MDNLSYYGTLGAILLIQISFAWLYRHQDSGFNRSLSREHIAENRLAIILVNYNHQFGRALKDRLEAFDFIIYAIDFSQRVSGVPVDTCDKTNGKIFNLDVQNTTLAEIERVTSAIVRELIQNQDKLHAFIDFRLPCSGNIEAAGKSLELSPIEVVHKLDRIKELVFRQISFSVLLSQKIKADKAKMVVVRDKVEESMNQHSGNSAQWIDSLAYRYSRNTGKPLIVQQISSLLQDYLRLIDNNCLSIDLKSPELNSDIAERRHLEQQQNNFANSIVSAILRL